MYKIDSPDCQINRFEYFNHNDPWDLACNHAFHLFCLSRSSKCINVFQLKGRPRDSDLVVYAGDINFQAFDFGNEEVSSFVAQTSEKHICIYLATVSGMLYFFRLDLLLQVLNKQCIFLGATIEDIALSENEVFVGTRSGDLFFINFKDVQVLKVDMASSSPLRISKFSNNTLMANSFDSSLLISRNSEKCIKRRINKWESEASAEFICRTGESFIIGIKDDALFFMTKPPISENILSRRSLFHNAKISAFALLDSGAWILGCSNLNDRRSYLKLFDKNGFELASLDHGTDEVVRILPIDQTHKFILVVLKTKDNCQSKLNLVETDSSRIETINEYICEGAVCNVKISGRYFIFYSIKEDFFAQEICPFSWK